MSDELIKAAEEAGQFITLSFPHTGTVTHSVKIHSPEFGDRFRSGRNQVIKTTRSGVSVAYDRGRNLDEEYTWSFNNISEFERAALLVFLEEVNWGASKVKITDWYGDDIIVRMAVTSLEQTNQRIQTLDGGRERTLYGFTLRFIDITDNMEELAIQDNPNMSNALKIHILNQDHPHNKLAFLPNIPTSPTTGIIDQVDIETEITDDSDGSTYRNKGAAFIATISKTDGTARAIAVVHATSNRDYDTPTAATVVKGKTIEWFEDGTEVSSVVTLDVVLAVGSSGQQVLQLNATTTAAGYRVQARRIKV